MSGLFADGRIVDLILLLVAVEGALWGWLLRKRSSPLNVALALLPGAALLIAVRLALTGADWRMVAAALAASLPLHLWDLARRFARRRT